MRQNEEESVQLRRALRSMADGARPRPGCPEPERLWDAVAGQLPVEQVREVVDHTASCPSCAEAWRLAHQLSRGAHEERQGVERPVFAARVSWRWAVAAAATVVLGVMGVQLWRTGPVGDPPAGYRDPGGETIRSLLLDGEALPRERFLLRWTADTGAVPRFDVRVATEDLQVIDLARGLEDPEYVVPEDALEQVSAGDRILWQVEAVMEDGSSAVSPTFVNRLE